jgi:hypothetical protein
MQEASIQAHQVKGSETRKFITERLRVLFDNLIEQVTDIDAFDYLSKVLLDLN